MNKEKEKIKIDEKNNLNKSLNYLIEKRINIFDLENIYYFNSNYLIIDYNLEVSNNLRELRERIKLNLIVKKKKRYFLVEVYEKKELKWNGLFKVFISKGTLNHIRHNIQRPSLDFEIYKEKPLIIFNIPHLKILEESDKKINLDKYKIKKKKIYWLIKLKIYYIIYQIFIFLLIDL